MPYINDLRKPSLSERWTRNNKPQRFLISSQDIVIQVSKYSHKIIMKTEGRSFYCLPVIISRGEVAKQIHRRDK